MIKNNKLEGIGIDFWKLIAKKADIDYSFKVMQSWDDVLNRIKNSRSFNGQYR